MSMTTDKPPTDADDDEIPYWQSRRTVAAGLVLVLLAVVVAWALTGGGDDKPTAQSAPATYESACGLTGGDTAMPTRGPDVQWQNIDGNWLPISPTQGPGRRSETGPWSCYAHTPSGAVLAAWGIPARMGVATDFAGVVKQQTLPGAAQAILLRNGPGTIPVAKRPVPIGYRINSYAREAATITMYLRQRGATISCATGVQWTGAEKGDWVLRLGSDGSVWLGCQQVKDTLRDIELVPWGPQS